MIKSHRFQSMKVIHDTQGPMDNIYMVVICMIKTYKYQSMVVIHNIQRPTNNISIVVIHNISEAYK